MNISFKQNRSAQRFLCMMAVCTIALSVAAPKIHAEKLKGGADASAPTNIGFMENPPKELKDKFPMCDKFLKVQWVDEEKEVAYSYYNIYVNGKKVGKPRGALIFLSEWHPHFDYDDTSWANRGKLRKLFSKLRRTRGIEHLTDDDRIHISPDDWSPISLADHRVNVCIPYPPHKSLGYYKNEFWNGPDKYDPGEQRMWIVEIRQVGKVYSDQQINHVLEKTYPAMSPPEDRSSAYDAPSDIRTYSVIDFNVDGIDDYLAGIHTVGDTIYSHGGEYFKMKPMWVRQIDATYGEYQFQTTGKTCRAGIPPDYYLTTDGKNFFLNNQCNLTELSK